MLAPPPATADDDEAEDDDAELRYVPVQALLVQKFASRTAESEAVAIGVIARSGSKGGLKPAGGVCADPAESGIVSTPKGYGTGAEKPPAFVTLVVCTVLLPLLVPATAVLGLGVGNNARLARAAALFAISCGFVTSGGGS